MGALNPINPIDPNLAGKEHLQGVSQTPESYGARRPFRITLSMSKPYIAEPAAIDQPSLVIAELTKGKASVGLREENSDTVYFVAENLKPQEAGKLVAELTKGKASVGVGEGTSDTVYFAENLKPQEAGKLVADITRGKIDLEELSKQEWREVEEVLTRFFNSVGEVSKETAISVASGIVGAALVTFFGPVGAIGISLGAAAAENSVGSGILGGTLVTVFGPVGAIVIPLGVAAAATKFKKT